ncbi:protein NRT1/ PTR FAMILY 1.2-like [Ipomoea triloba]|uniref:protein NRT1/ PTR FAMILY 1.2-like n=1 Tax=Ipomoea triloba TaxID=35885 RepID=UPI00125D47B3|nr:protein NRT1/ PTR FAMILY 1.2-like [Ipomoea triloba]
MEDLSEEKENEEPLLITSSQTSKGGFRTFPFIIGNSALLFLAIYALTPDMILYLMKEYNMDMASGSNVLYLWSAALNFTPVIGALMADSFVGRFQMIGLGSALCLLGMAMFWSTTVIPQLRPPPCSENDNVCTSATKFQLLTLFTSFIVVALGSGAARSCSLAFGADQLQDLQKTTTGSMERYFGWYYAISSFSVLVAMTVLVYIQENMGWEIGYGVLVVIMLISLVVFFLGSSFYVKPKVKESLIVGLIQVAVASYRKRNLKCCEGNSSEVAYHQKGSSLLLPTEKLRFLNKACIIQDPQRDLTSDGKPTDPWNLCTVDQVEELKALLKVTPIWFTGVIMSINVSQGSFGTLQATTMDRRIGSTFEIPAGSVGMFAIVSVVLWIVLYDRFIIPLASRAMRKPVRFSTKSRMGCGIFVSFLSVVVAATVETIRRRRAINEGFANNPDEVVGMSVLWLVPNNLLAGFAEGLSAVAQNEFYISEFPKSMSSIASSLFLLGMGFASLLASLVMNAINDFTGGGEESWISSNINKGHYDYYQWILAGLSVVNLLLFFVCSRAYGPCKDENMEVLALGREDQP